MKKNLVIAFLLLIVNCMTAYAQFESATYRQYAQYDASGKQIGSESNGTTLTLNVYNVYGGGTRMSAYQSSTIGGHVMPSMPLCPANQAFIYQGVDNGWYVYNYMNTVIIYVSGNVARVARYAGGQYLGYTEFRK